jgi:hypothetical protein
MSSKKVEVEREDEIVGEACFTLRTSLDRIWLPLNYPNQIWKIVDVIARNLDEKYHKNVFVCVRSSRVDAAISNVYNVHIDTCTAACLSAFEAVGCGYKKEEVDTACHTHCHKLVRQVAYNSLYETYIKVAEELERLGYKYTAKFDEEDAPQRMRIIVWF